MNGLFLANLTPQNVNPQQEKHFVRRKDDLFGNVWVLLRRTAIQFRHKSNFDRRCTVKPQGSHKSTLRNWSSAQKLLRQIIVNIRLLSLLPHSLTYLTYAGGTQNILVSPRRMHCNNNKQEKFHCY